MNYGFMIFEQHKIRTMCVYYPVLDFNVNYVQITIICTLGILEKMGDYKASIEFVIPVFLLKRVATSPP